MEYLYLSRYIYFQRTSKTNDEEYFDNEDEFEEARGEYATNGWEGDLKLIKVINLSR